ncbi:hypothetical protein MTO96_025041 [Rhipicephalus appendiculatus]
MAYKFKHSLAFRLCNNIALLRVVEEKEEPKQGSVEGRYRGLGPAWTGVWCPRRGQRTSVAQRLRPPGQRILRRRQPQDFLSPGSFRKAPAAGQARKSFEPGPVYDGDENQEPAVDVVLRAALAQADGMNLDVVFSRANG